MINITIHTIKFYSRLGTIAHTVTDTIHCGRMSCFKLALAIGFGFGSLARQTRHETSGAATVVASDSQVALV